MLKKSIKKSHNFSPFLWSPIRTGAKPESRESRKSRESLKIKNRT